MKKTYSELITLPTFSERYEYLKLNGIVGKETFGHNRWLNQEFYHSREWLRFRDRVIVRDEGRDLGMPGFEIFGPILIHHLNPVSYEDIIHRNACVFDLDNVVCTQLKTHNAIHYGDGNLLVQAPIERRINDTCPWK